MVFVRPIIVLPKFSRVIESAAAPVTEWFTTSTSLALCCAAWTGASPTLATLTSESPETSITMALPATVIPLSLIATTLCAAAGLGNVGGFGVIIGRTTRFHHQARLQQHGHRRHDHHQSAGELGAKLCGDTRKPANVLLPNLTEVEVVNTNSNSLVATIPVGNNPVAMAETPDTKKLYVANQDDSTISGFNTGDRSSRTVSGSFHAPLWVVARSDSQRLYVLNGNGVVSTVDTHTTTGPDTVIDASVNAPGAAYMLYDGNTNRLYIPGGSRLQTMLDVSQSVPAVLTGAPIAIPTVQPTSRSAGGSLREHFDSSP